MSTELLYEHSLKIGWMDISIKFVDKIIHDNEECDGLFDPTKSEILIRHDLQNHMKRKVLIHEITHAVLYVFSGDSCYTNEVLVENITNGIMTLFKDNDVFSIIGDL